MEPVTVQAEALDGSGVVATKDVTISGQKIKVSKITIDGPDSVTGTGKVTMDKLYYQRMQLMAR